jgi:hypothetical protein
MTENILIALIGIVGAVIGSVATVAVQWFNHYMGVQSQLEQDRPRKELLGKMLRSPKYPWRKLDTLMHVIGADEENTKRLLLDLGARASEDGQSLWGLIERNPLADSQQ